MTKVMSKLVQGGGALVLAIVLALSLLPVTRAYAADTYPVRIIQDNLTGATASARPVMGASERLTVFIEPHAGKRFLEPPTVIPTNAEIVESLVWVESENNYVVRIANPTGEGDVIITVSGEATAAYSASLNLDSLEGASATLSKSANIAANESVTVTITPNAGTVFSAAPVVTPLSATASAPQANPLTGVYTCTISNFTQNETISISGVTEDVYTATLNKTNLVGATAALSHTTGIKATDTVNLTVTPNAGSRFSSKPLVTANGATVDAGKEASNGAWQFVLSNFTASATITVTGVATSDEAKITISGDDTHITGSGDGLTVTCTLPLEDLLDVFVDGKKVAKSNYAAKSGSTIVTFKTAYLDTLAPGKHTVKLAYTNDRSASIDFKVAAKTDGKSDGKSDGTGDKSLIPDTGDPLAAPLAGATGVAALAALAGVAALRRKQRQ